MEQNVNQYTVKATTSGYNGITKYLVYRVGGGRVSVHAYGTRDAAQVHADNLNIAALVKDHAEDPRPYAVRLEEAKAAYANGKEAPGYCAGCGQTFNGARGLRSHRSAKFMSNACKGIGAPAPVETESVEEQEEPEAVEAPAPRPSAYDQELLPVGTPVRITGGGLFIGSTGKIAKAYRIRFGHRMYDVELPGGHVCTYHAESQLEVLDRDARRDAAIERAKQEDAAKEAPAREVKRDHLVANPRTSNQVLDAVRSLNRKLGRVNRHGGLSKITATLEGGVIVVRYVEPDRSMTGQPDAVHAEAFLDVNMSAVWLYRAARDVYRDGLHAEIQAYLKVNPFGPSPASTESWD